MPLCDAGMWQFFSTGHQPVTDVQSQVLHVPNPLLGLGLTIAEAGISMLRQW
jgi:hypothetical protein